MTDKPKENKVHDAGASKEEAKDAYLAPFTKGARSDKLETVSTRMPNIQSGEGRD